MDPSLQFVLDEIRRKFDEIDARWEQRFAGSRAAQKQQDSAAVDPHVGNPKRYTAAQLHAPVAADNWGGLFDEPVPAPDATSNDSDGPPSAPASDAAFDSEFSCTDGEAFSINEPVQMLDFHFHLGPVEYPLPAEPVDPICAGATTDELLHLTTKEAKLTVKLGKERIEAWPFSFVVPFEQDPVQIHDREFVLGALSAPRRPRRATPRPPRLRQPQRAPPRPPWFCHTRSRRAHGPRRASPWRRRPLRRLIWRPPWRHASFDRRPRQHRHHVCSRSLCPDLEAGDALRTGPGPVGDLTLVPAWGGTTPTPTATESCMYMPTNCSTHVLNGNDDYRTNIIALEFEGVQDFAGLVSRISEYMCGETFCGKRVRVVNCGNCGWGDSPAEFRVEARTANVTANVIHAVAVPSPMTVTSLDIPKAVQTLPFAVILVATKHSTTSVGCLVLEELSSRYTTTIPSVLAVSFVLLHHAGSEQVLEFFPAVNKRLWAPPRQTSYTVLVHTVQLCCSFGPSFCMGLLSAQFWLPWLSYVLFEIRYAGVQISPFFCRYAIYVHLMKTSVSIITHRMSWACMQIVDGSVVLSHIIGTITSGTYTSGAAPLFVRDDSSNGNPCALRWQLASSNTQQGVQMLVLLKIPWQPPVCPCCLSVPWIQLPSHVWQNYCAGLFQWLSRLGTIFSPPYIAEYLLMWVSSYNGLFSAYRNTCLMSANGIGHYIFSLAESISFVLLVELKGLWPRKHTSCSQVPANWVKLLEHNFDRSMQKTRH